MRCILAAFLVVALPALVCCRLAAEVFVLDTGGRLEGRLANPDESPREKYIIETSTGGRLTLDRAQVKEVIRPRPEEIEYEKVRHKHPDTVEGHWALAEWCREHRLPRMRRQHLERIIELAPDHARARAALGYSRVQGKWKTRRQVMTERGYVEYKGRWVLPQEVELLERKRQDELAEAQWRKKLKRWDGWLDTEKAEEALRHIARIDDPYAVPALADSLAKEPLETRRKLYIEALARVAAPQAWEVLAARSLEDPNEEVRLTCLDYLDDEPRPAVVEYYIEKLRSKDNAIVNRAAVGLERMNDPAAIGPLVEALVTTHKFKIDMGQPGIGASFDQSGRLGSFGFGGGGTKLVSRKFQNAEVLDALVTLTEGINFDYDIRAWQNWLATQKRPEGLNARRD